MSDETTPTEEPAPKRSKLPLILGVLMMLGLGGGGFYAAYAGLIPGLGGKTHKTENRDSNAPLEVAYVPIDPLVISVEAEPGGRYLHFVGQIEVEKAHEAEVRLILPRVMDVLNGYLRAVEVSDLEDPKALIRLRAQMLRRVQMVAGEGRARDLLVTEFVIN